MVENILLAGQNHVAHVPVECIAVCADVLNAFQELGIGNPLAVLYVHRFETSKFATRELGTNAQLRNVKVDN